MLPEMETLASFLCDWPARCDLETPWKKAVIPPENSLTKRVIKEER